MRFSVPLAAEIAAARAVAGLSRLVGAGGGTTVPGKLLSKVDPGAIDRLASRLPAGAAVLSATNGKTTTAAMAAEILRPAHRLAHNGSGANLVSGVASTLLAANGAELGLFEVDEAALPEIVRRVRPRVVCLSNLFRDQLDRYGELELVAARWRDAVAALPEEAVLVVNGDDPQVGDLARTHARATIFGLDDPRLARPALQHAADSKYCVRCGAPYEYAAAYVGHLGDYRCPRGDHARPPLEVAARAVELHGLERASFDLVAPEGTRRSRARAAGPLQRLQRRRRGRPRAGARRVARRDHGGAGTVQCRLRPLRADPGRRQAAPAAAGEEPGRREREPSGRSSTAARPGSR